MTTDELLQTLTEREALIVHCSRTGKGDEGLDGLLYPDDLIQAIRVCGEQSATLSCSLIWPNHIKTFGPIGIILKPRSAASITSISPGDAGTSIDLRDGERIGGGNPLSHGALEDVFANSKSYNEITVKDADTVGVFINLAMQLSVSQIVNIEDVDGYDEAMPIKGAIVGQIRQKLSDIISHFPQFPVFAFLYGELVEISANSEKLYEQAS